MQREAVYRPPHGSDCKLPATSCKGGLDSLLIYGANPARCKLQAASCKVTTRFQPDSVGSILRGASCKLQAAKSPKSVHLTLWGRAASLRAAESRASHLWCRSCELRAASCKLQSHKKVEPRTCGVHPASCELRAASLRTAEKSSLGPVQNDAWQQLQCVGGGLPSRSCDAAARRCCRFQGEGGYCLGQVEDLSPN